ncbi:MAG TPA: acyl-CoA desaturase [Cytophagaceae bacterium]|jgi:stearoyl-CoA desaturase (delta-9 desaturase)|nr:acyl-CoA desaturase [Cytophagaceae bacterium]
MIILIFFILHWYLSLFTQTFFDHRYAAHKMFSMNKFWEKFFYILSYIFQGSSYLSPKVYGIMHRMHHAYSDTERDPHSPHYHNNAFTMMLHTRNIYNDIDDNKFKSEDRFTKDLPQWKLLDKIGGSLYSRVAWALLYTTFYIIFADQWWMFILLPIHFAMGAVHGAIVNWFGHKVGYSNFDNNDRSKNTLVFDFLMLGELFQNNHHKNSLKPNFTSRWFEIDPVYPVLKFLDLLKIIRLAPKFKLTI